MSAFGGKADIAAKLLTHDEARRIAANIARLPGANSANARSIRIAPSESRRARSRERLICTVLCAEATNSADICLALLKTRKAAILRTGTVIVYCAPGIILGFGRSVEQGSNNDKAEHNQEFHVASHKNAC